MQILFHRAYFSVSLLLFLHPWFVACRVACKWDSSAPNPSTTIFVDSDDAPQPHSAGKQRPLDMTSKPAVYAAFCSGGGLTSLPEFCGCMGLQGITSQAYYSHQKAVRLSVQAVAGAHLADIRTVLKSRNFDTNPVVVLLHCRIDRSRNGQVRLTLMYGRCTRDYLFCLLPIIECFTSMGYLFILILHWMSPGTMEHRMCMHAI